MEVEKTVKKLVVIDIFLFINRISGVFPLIGLSA